MTYVCYGNIEGLRLATCRGRILGAKWTHILLRRSDATSVSEIVRSRWPAHVDHIKKCNSLRGWKLRHVLRVITQLNHCWNELPRNPNSGWSRGVGAMGCIDRCGCWLVDDMQNSYNDASYSWICTADDWGAVSGCKEDVKSSRRANQIFCDVGSKMLLRYFMYNKYPVQLA